MKAFVADTAEGYQALCPPHWAGEMQTVWFEARLDAIVHSLAVHDTAPFIPVAPPWLDLLKGPPHESDTGPRHRV